MNYIGIDLGTTNSAITSFDGRNTKVWKSPEQNDVTPSVIYINKRGGKMYGQSAYNAIPRDPGNTAKLFKRLMGSSTRLHFDCGVDMTPEECSSEILKTLFGYLPDNIREDKNTGVVITVPAAFNQMQKDATKDAAYAAGIGNVALIQEPVAAIMSIAKSGTIDGTFLVYDYGGGTFDISIAQCVGSKANLLTNDGIQYCGGRDLDKAIYEGIVVPWLIENFCLPDDFKSNEKYSVLTRMAMWATERAKIELSSKNSTVIRLDEVETRCHDEEGKEIYLDVPFSREEYEKIIFPRIDVTIEKTRDVINDAGLNTEDIECIVFIGGPTMYSPLREYVSNALGITANTDVNPMTAVSEGAAIYAESVNFDSEDGGQKGDVCISHHEEHNLELRYNSRTSADKAKIAVIFEGAETLDFIFTSADTGWNSGLISLSSGSFVSVDLYTSGENKFLIQCFEKNGARVEIEDPEIIIVKTAINIGKIPCAHSVAVEIEDSITHEPKLDYLIKKDDLLPKKGSVTYKTTLRVKAGSDDCISLKLWEGEIEEPVDYNRLIGDINIDGFSFDSGMIPIGSPVECEYTFNDSGNLKISVKIPSVGITLKRDNFYNRHSGQIDYENDTDKIIDEAKTVYNQLEGMDSNPEDERLNSTVANLGNALSKEDMDAEDVQMLAETTQSAKSVMASYAHENKQKKWQNRLDDLMEKFHSYQDKIPEGQQKQVKALVESINRAIASNSSSAERYLDELDQIVTNAIFSDDDTYKMIFFAMASNPSEFTDSELYSQYIAEGMTCLVKNDIDGLKDVLTNLLKIQVPDGESKVNEVIKRSGITK